MSESEIQTTVILRHLAARHLEDARTLLEHAAHNLAAEALADLVTELRLFDQPDAADQTLAYAATGPKERFVALSRVLLDRRHDDDLRTLLHHAQHD